MKIKFKGRYDHLEDLKIKYENLPIIKIICLSDNSNLSESFFPKVSNIINLMLNRDGRVFPCKIQEIKPGLLRVMDKKMNTVDVYFSNFLLYEN